jgi:predicted nucleotidyltransferase
MTTSVSDTLRSCIHKVLEQHSSIALAYLFGSTARSRTTMFSDVDIALVLFENSITPFERLRFELMIEDVLAADCHLSNADVHVINDAPLIVKGQILTDGQLLFSRDEEMRITFETYTRLAYFDFQPVAESLRTAFFDKLLRDGLYG